MRHVCGAYVVLRSFKRRNVLIKLNGLYRFHFNRASTIRYRQIHRNEGRLFHEPAATCVGQFHSQVKTLNKDVQWQIPNNVAFELDNVDTNCSDFNVGGVETEQNKRLVMAQRYSLVREYVCRMCCCD